jgi:hypothetical protein
MEKIITKRWEIYVSLDDYLGFSEFLNSNNVFSFSHSLGTKWWMVTYATEEIKLMAKLKFSVNDVVYNSGIV